MVTVKLRSVHAINARYSYLLQTFFLKTIYTNKKINSFVAHITTAFTSLIGNWPSIASQLLRKLNRGKSLNCC